MTHAALIPEVRLLLESAGGSARFTDAQIARALGRRLREDADRGGEFKKGGGRVGAKAAEPKPAADKAGSAKGKKGRVLSAVLAAADLPAEAGRAAYVHLAPKVRRFVLAVHHKLEAGFHAAHALVAETARQRGLPEAHVERVARVVAAADAIARWTVSTGVWAAASAAGQDEAAAVGAKVAYYLPVASLGYLAYSAARDPHAVLRAARKLVERAASKPAALHESLEAGQDAVAELLGLLNEAADRDLAEAVVAAALDETHDLAAAVALARKALEQSP